MDCSLAESFYSRNIEVEFRTKVSRTICTRIVWSLVTSQGAPEHVPIMMLSFNNFFLLVLSFQEVLPILFSIFYIKWGKTSWKNSIPKKIYPIALPRSIGRENVR